MHNVALSMLKLESMELMCFMKISIQINNILGNFNSFGYTNFATSTDTISEKKIENLSTLMLPPIRQKWLSSYVFKNYENSDKLTQKKVDNHDKDKWEIMLVSYIQNVIELA